jgi:predicted DsbA family dithiol-disulfide isomerase
MFKAFFQEEKNIGNIEVLAELAAEIGLDKNEFTEALKSRKYKAIHQQALKHAFNEANITAVPTFVIGETVLQGIYPKQVLEKVIDEELSKQAVNRF